MFNKKIIFPGLLSTLVMFCLSCLWHGVVLNDFARIQYPMPVFLGFLALLYVVISLLMVVASRYLNSPKNNYSKGAIIGLTTGGIVFLIAFVLGLSFTPNYEPIMALMDFVWQIIEQTSGGLVAAYAITAIERREAFLN